MTCVVKKPLKYSLTLLAILLIIITNPKFAGSEPQSHIEWLEVSPNMIVPEGETYESIVQLDKQFIKEIITMKAKEYGVNAQVAIKIAECESSLNIDAFNPSNRDGSSDKGLYQINSVHYETTQSLGLDVKSSMYDNIEYAMMLMKENGTRDWYSSQHCWSKV